MPNSPPPNSAVLPLIPTMPILDLKLSRIDHANDDVLIYYIGGRVSPVTKGIGARLFIGRDSTVSSDPQTYSYALTMPIDSLTGELDQRYYLHSSALSTYGFKRGDQIFIVAYPVASPYIAFTCWNPQLERNVEIGLGPRSTVLSFKTQ